MAGLALNLAGVGYPLLPRTYYIFPDQWEILLYEIELGEQAAFDLFHHDDIMFGGSC